MTPQSAAKLHILLETYKCLALTAIAALLAVLLWHTPAPLTLESLRASKTTGWVAKVPLVYVADGSVSIDGTVPVEVENGVQVTGSVEIDR
jgi:hypothetical protein